MRRRLLFAVLLFPFLMGAVSAGESYLKEIAAWKKERLDHLNADDGWPTLVGLFWLHEGDNAVGSDKSSPVTLPPSAPAKAGILKFEKGKVRFVAEVNSPVTLDGASIKAPVEMVADVDAKDKPTTIRAGSISFFIIKRGDKTGVRVRDSNSPSRKALSSLQYYPVDPAWRIEATFEPYRPAKKIPIANVLGMVEPTDSAGALVFEIQGSKYRLDALEEDGDKEGEKVLFVIFADRTNAKETYGAGRFLYTDMPDRKGKVILDFNKAYSPPCAFTPYATCPLPPKENKLPLAIPAGEKRPAEAR